MEKRNISEKSVANNQISCHCKLDLESSTLAVLESKTINDLRGRSRIKYGMTSLFNNGKYIEASPTQRGSMQTVKDVFICPPCGENVAQATKEGQNRKKSLWPLLPRLTAVLPPQGREITTRGFTLIELLVVVLIIGILAAVAVPQYQKALLKSRYSTLMPVTKAVADAQEVFYMGNGHYATIPTDLDVSPQATNTENINLSISEEETHSFVLANHTQAPNAHYIMYQQHSENFPGEIHCEAAVEDELANWLCEKGLGGTPLESGRSLTDGFNAYILVGSGKGTYAKTYYNTGKLALTNGDKCVAQWAYACGKTKAEDGSICEVTEEAGEGTAPCDNSTFTNGSICKGNGGNMPCRKSTFIDSSCEGTGGRLCLGSNFTNSSCKGTGSGACNDSTFTNSTCEGSCSNSTFTNSTCTKNCGDSSFTDSTCYATSSGRACGGTKAMYNHSVCYNQSNGMYPCGQATYTNGSQCHSNEYGGCGGKAVFDTGSVCYGNGVGACGGGDTYKNNSVCYANVSGACNENKYESGSYCAGDFCPAGSPTQDGQCWDGNGSKVACS